MKSLNRNSLLALDAKRQEIDAKKTVVDRLQLDYQNLLYEEGYLLREIKGCKDLPTPNLDEIEAELGKPLATKEYSEQLHKITQSALSALSQEQNARNAEQKALKKQNTAHEQLLKKLDKKRKFLDELPGKIELIRSSASDLQSSFATIISEGKPADSGSGSASAEGTADDTETGSTSKKAKKTDKK